MSRATTAAPRRPRAPGAPQRRAGADLVLAWPRIRRILLILVVVGLASSYVRPVVTWVGTRGEAAHQEQRLQRLTHTERRLTRERVRLRTARGLAIEARRLGMVHEGERAYVVHGLPRG